MKPNRWSVAFTIVVNGLQIDFMELPQEYRVHILRCLFEGETNGTLDNENSWKYQKAV